MNNKPATKSDSQKQSNYKNETKTSISAANPPRAKVQCQTKHRILFTPKNNVTC